MGKLKWVTKSDSFSCQYLSRFTKSVSFPSAFRVTLFRLSVSGPLSLKGSCSKRVAPASGHSGQHRRVTKGAAPGTSLRTGIEREKAGHPACKSCQMYYLLVWNACNNPSNTSTSLTLTMCHGTLKLSGSMATGSEGTQATEGIRKRARPPRYELGLAATATAGVWGL